MVRVSPKGYRQNKRTRTKFIVLVPAVLDYLTPENRIKSTLIQRGRQTLFLGAILKVSKFQEPVIMFYVSYLYVFIDSYFIIGNRVFVVPQR